MSKLTLVVSQNGSRIGGLRIDRGPVQVTITNGADILLDLNIATLLETAHHIASKSKRTDGDDFTMPLPIGVPESGSMTNRMADEPDADTHILAQPTYGNREAEVLSDAKMMNPVNVSERDDMATHSEPSYDNTFANLPPSLPFQPRRVKVKPLEFWELRKGEWTRLQTIQVDEKLRVFRLHVWYQASGELLFVGQEKYRIVGVHADGREQEFFFEGGTCTTPFGLPIVVHGGDVSYCLRPVKEH